MSETETIIDCEWCHERHGALHACDALRDWAKLAKTQHRRISRFGSDFCSCGRPWPCAMAPAT